MANVSDECGLASYHVNHHFPERLALLLAKILEDVAVFLLKQFESHSEVVVLQHRLVIIHQSEF